jgi:predicted enzyme related to lactoylglutathione lyase
MKLKASLAMVSLPSSNVARSKAFYETLLGIDLVRNLDESTESYHTPVSDDGTDLHVGPSRHPKETTTVHFHVDDLDASIKALTDAGGTLVFGPQPITMSDKAFQAYAGSYKQVEPGGPNPAPLMSRWAVVQDPGGSAIGLLQSEPHLHRHFQVGSFQRPLADFQVAQREAGKANAAKVF